MAKIVSSVQKFVSIFISKELFGKSALLGFHTLLSLIPIVGITFWYLSQIGVTDQGIALLRGFILKHLNLDSSEKFVFYFDKLTSEVQQGWGTVGILILFYTASSLVQKLGESFDQILDIPIPKNWWIPMLKRALVTLFLPIPVVLSLLTLQLIQKGSIIHTFLGWIPYYSYALLLLPWIADTIVYFLLYRFIPNRRYSMKAIGITAVIIAVATSLLRFGFGIYSSYSVSVHKIYGVFAVLPLFMIWLQWDWLVILSGAVLLGFLSKKFPLRSQHRSPLTS